jgi:thymidylate synthase (FAD)
MINKPDEQVKDWYLIHTQIAKNYGKFLKEYGWKPQEARGILPNDLKTEIIVTMNLRELRHFFTLRCHPAAHPDIRVIAFTLLEMLHKKIPLLFDDLYDEFKES